ncbi:MAG: tetratricopeptide repeat protein [Actinomycetota bacterium]|nr:tetratricopeptide repeat protein [Actinomycetota bacterium]
MQPSEQAFESDVDVLLARLGRYPRAQYPVQHAVTQFHLGVALLQEGRAADASAALTVARAGFIAAGLVLELAKTVNMLGVAMREVGDLTGAAESFGAAAIAFAKLEQRLEEAAASYNLGLVTRLLGDSAKARPALTRAKELFEEANLPGQAGAAARELGTLLLTDGHLHESIEVLGDAVNRAQDSGDGPGLGAAANALGLAHLAAGAAADAIASFRMACSVHPRSLRPAEHAMAKANLALAQEQAGDPARARLAATQALGVSAVTEPVRELAQAVLGRLPRSNGADLFDVLDDEPDEGWAVLFRDEVTRWGDCSPAQRATTAQQWLDGVLQRSGRGPELTEAFLNALLELPPAAYERIVEAVVRATGERDPAHADRFRSITRSGMARFPIPQWQRMAATFNSAAQRNGEPADWS